MLKNERAIFLFIKAPKFLLSRTRNIFYSLAFSARALRIGRQSTFRNTKNISVGDYVSIGDNVWIDAISKGVIRIGSHVSLSQNVHIASSFSVTIEDGCLIGSDVLITDHNHSFSMESAAIYPKNRPLNVKGKTHIGRNTWLGDNVKILSGVVLGENTVVAANSVVISSFPGNVVLAGTPAAIIKYMK